MEKFKLPPSATEETVTLTFSPRQAAYIRHMHKAIAEEGEGIRRFIKRTILEQALAYRAQELNKAQRDAAQHAQNASQTAARALREESAAERQELKD